MTSTYLLRQADALLNLSRATFDLTVAGRLRVLAAEFRAEAQELERDGRSPPRIRARQPLPAALTGWSAAACIQVSPRFSVSPPGLTRGSIFLRKKGLREGDGCAGQAP